MPRLPARLRDRPSRLGVVGAVLALPVLARLAYVGALRLLARGDGVAVPGHPAVDAAAAVVGVAGSLALLAVLATAVRRARPRRAAAP